MKKFTALLLIFSLLMLSVNLYAKERRGAEIIIQRKIDQVKKTRLEGTPWEISDRTGIKGELIAVKQDSILLLDAEGKDVSVNIEDIKVIIIVKKSTAGTGALIGFISLAGISAGLILAFLHASDAFTVGNAILGIAVFGGIGALIGGISGAFTKGSKKIHIEGMTDSEIQETLDYLRKKARVRDYK